MQEKDQNISPIKQRILQYVAQLGISKRDFYQRIGVSRGTLESKTGITEDTLAKFIAIYPEVNLEWLLTGEGEMLKGGVSVTCEPETEVVRHNVRTFDRTIEMQQIPLYDIAAAAGIVQIIQGDNSHIPIDHISIPNAPRCDGGMYVRGDSMYPLLKSGDIILYKEVHDLRMITWGEIYLIAYVDDHNEIYIVVKYIKPGSSADTLLLVSQNQHHAEKEIPVQSVRALAQIKVSVRFQSW